MSLRALSLSLLIVSCLARAQDAPAMTAEQFEATLEYRHGSIALPGGKAALEVPENFRYLGPADAARLLADGWGNPPGAETLGMLIPAGTSPLGPSGWGVVITYEEDGHVSDEDADTIDYAAMLQEMQESSEAANAERREAGYEDVHLIGWAEAPFYDQSTRKLHWAKELTFGSSEASTLNYNVRVLGREGVLVLNAVAGMDRFSEVKEGMREVVQIANFTPGNTYADFNADTDQVAAYGLAALVGGAVAAKTGLLAKLVALLLAGKKFIFIAAIALFAGFRKFFGGKGGARGSDGRP